MGDRADQGVVEPQLLSQVIELNTKLNLSLTTQNQTETPSQKVMELTRFRTVSDPQLCSTKESHIHLEAHINHHYPPKRILDLNMANELFLDSFSLHDESIELRHRAMTLCTESSTLHYSQWEKLSN